MSALTRWLKSTIDVRKNEIAVTLLMVFYIYLLLVTYYLLKPARDSLFLSNTGPAFLPLVFVLIAVVVVPATTLYSRISRSLPLNRLINTTTVIIISNLFILRWLLNFEGQDWVFYVFYIWVSIYGALATSQSWLFANAVYNSSQAKRIFVIFSLAAILGAFTGGSITSLIVTAFGVSTEDLLYFCAVFLAICLPLVNTVWRMRPKGMPTDRGRKKSGAGRKKSDESWSQMFADIRKSRHLRLIMGIIAMTMATASFVDYQFKFVSTDSYSTYRIEASALTEMLSENAIPQGVAEKVHPLIAKSYGGQEEFRNALDDILTANEAQSFGAVLLKRATSTDKEQLTAFLGEFYGGLSLLGFLFQLLFSYRALKIFGVGGVILFLPISQVLASIGMLIAPTLTTAVLLRGSDGVFKYSIDKTARELLFLPIPLDVKKRSKIFIDLFIDRVFRGISGLILLFFTLELQLTMRQLSIIVICLVVVWIFLDLMVRREYLNAFRQALKRGQIHPDAVNITLDDPATVNHVVSALRSESERQVRYALQLLKGNRQATFQEPLKALLDHSNEDIRGQVVRILRDQQALDENLRQRLQKDSSIAVNTELLAMQVDESPGNRSEILQTALDDSPLKQAAAVSYLANVDNTYGPELLSPSRIEQLLSTENRPDKALLMQIAEFLGIHGEAENGENLRTLINNADVAVARAGILAVGQSRNHSILPILFDKLQERNLRATVRESLALFGDEIIPELDKQLTDKSLPFSLRNALPRVLRSIGTPAATDVLMKQYGHDEPAIDNSILSALYNIRIDNPDISIDLPWAEKILEVQCTNYYLCRHFHHQLQTKAADNSSGRLLLKSLQEKALRNQRNLFNILALIYPAEDMHNAAHGFLSSVGVLRANAAEFLENAVEKKHLRLLLPMLEEGDELGKSSALFGFTIGNADDALLQISSGDDPWLQACAIYFCGDQQNSAVVDQIKRNDEPKHHWVRETLELVSQQQKS